MREAIEKTQPDGVIVSSPNNTHLDMLLECARTDVPVLLEKPALVNSEQYTKVLASAPHRYLDKKVLIGHHRVHSYQISKAKDLIQSGKLGKLVGFTGRAVFYKPKNYFEVAPWRSKTGGGPLLINMIHEIQTMRLLLGEIKSVSGLLSHNLRKFEVEDTACFSLVFQSGAIWTFFVSDVSVSPFSWEMTSKENPVYPYHPEIGCYEVYGEFGTLTVPNLRLYSQSPNKVQSWWNPIDIDNFPRLHNDPIEQQYKHFCEVISGATRPIVNLKSGMQNVIIVEEMISNSLRLKIDHENS